MVRYSLFSLLFGLSVSWAGAQVLISQYPLNPGRLSTDDFWNFSTTASSGPLKGYFVVDLKAEGRTLFRLRSTEVEIKPGFAGWKAKEITYTEDLFNREHPYAAYIGQSRNLPFGRYEACVQLLDLSGNELGESCLEHEFNPLTPVSLLAPDYCSEQSTLYPVFTWLAPTPYLQDYPLVYDLKICEVFEGQTHQDAIDHNIPWHSASGLSSTTYPYPLTAARFDTSKTYVWQVSARISRPVFGEYDEPGQSWKGLGESEVWCFHWKPEEEPKDFQTSHIYPKTVPDGGYVNVANQLPLAFQHKRAPGQLKVRFTDKGGRELEYRPTLDLKKGDNRYELNLRESRAFQHKGYYTAIITDPQGKEYRILFRYWEK